MSLLILSNEILLNHIFTYLEIPDLFKVMHSCSRLSNFLRDANRLWKTKFKERWPRIIFNDQEDNQINWMERVNYRLRITAQVKEIVRSMSSLCYPERPEKHTPEDIMHKLTTGEYPHLEFVDDELTRLKFWPVEEFVDDLTLAYYVAHLYTRIKMFVLEKKLSNYMAQPESQKSLFEGAMLISHWINMDFQDSPNYSDTELTLNWIVERVKFLLMETRNHSFNGTEIQPTERETLVTISKVMFQEMKFLNLWVEEDEVNERARHVGCGCFSAAGYSVDMVLVSDSRICHNDILCIIYQEVARRMGILCEPIACSRYCWLVLRWLEFPEQAEGFTYIDMCSKGSLRRIDERRRLGPFFDRFGDENFYIVEIGQPVATAEYIFRKMLKVLASEDDRRMCTIEHGYSEYSQEYWVYPTSYICRLVCAISPSIDLVETYAKLCKYKRIQFAEGIRRCEELNVPYWDLEELLDEHHRKLTQKVVCFRLPEVKYAVGLVMIYKDTSRPYLRKRICAITSWDPKYKSPYGSTYIPPGINIHQPFYHVLLDEGKFKYVPENKLELHPDPSSVSLKNREFGLHFRRYNGRRYVPNAEKNLHFPEDDEFARSLIGEN